MSMDKLSPAKRKRALNKLARRQERAELRPLIAEHHHEIVRDPSSAEEVFNEEYAKDMLLEMVRYDLQELLNTGIDPATNQLYGSIGAFDAAISSFEKDLGPLSPAQKIDAEGIRWIIHSNQNESALMPAHG